MLKKVPIPENEIDRIVTLSEYNLDHATLRKSFDDLTLLAARFTGTEVSMVNLLDTYNQWTVSKHGIAIDHMPREESVCQYTIAGSENFEVKDLSADDRFKDFGYVAGDAALRYYYGVPITTSTGHNLGALCVLDRETKQVTDEKKELLQIIAREIVNRLNTFKQVETLQQRITTLNDSRKMLAHDIRGPLSGILGLSQLATERFSHRIDGELSQYLELITDSSRSMIDMARDILEAELTLLKQNTSSEQQYTVALLRDKINFLFKPIVLKKQQELIIDIEEDTAYVPFLKNRILQVLGNLVSNAIKFTQEHGTITVTMALVKDDEDHNIHLKVADTGFGMTAEQVTAIMGGTSAGSTGEEEGESYGFGLALVKQIADSMHGTMSITSQPSKGTTFNIVLPQLMLA